jgi:hypothetical protein
MVTKEKRAAKHAVGVETDIKARNLSRRHRIWRPQGARHGDHR